MSFKSEWKGCHPVKTIKNKEFHWLPYGKNLFCLYRGRDVKPKSAVFTLGDANKHVYRGSTSVLIKCRILIIPKSLLNEISFD